MTDVSAYAWPMARCSEALQSLASLCKVPCQVVDVATPATLACGSQKSVAGWLERVAESMGLAVHDYAPTYDSLPHTLSHPDPQMVLLQGEQNRLLVLAGAKGRWATVVEPGGDRKRIAIEELQEAICRPETAPLEPWAASIATAIPPGGAPADRVRKRLLARRLGALEVTRCFSLAGDRDVGLWQQARRADLRGRLVSLCVTHLAQQLALILSWWIIGRAVFGGTIAPGWMVCWVLLLLAIIPLRATATWSQAVLMLGIGGLIKNRLLAGALRLEPEDIRQFGSGQLLGKSMEAHVFQSHAIEGVFALWLAGLELVAAAAVIYLGAAGWLGLLGLALWFGFLWWVTSRYYRALRDWTTARLQMTEDLVEQMIGYRTRTVQMPRRRWHTEEERSLVHYFECATRLDRCLAMVHAARHAWLLVAVASLGPAFMAGHNTAALAVGLGGALLAYSALGRLSMGMVSLLVARLALRELRPLAQGKGGRRELRIPVLSQPTPSPGEPLLKLEDVSFHYPRSERPVIREANLNIRAGDHFLLEGASGCGKSTLAGLLSGVEKPSHGLTLYRGLDEATLGETGWRQGVALAPQFHQNHIFSGTLCYNLFLGNWPPEKVEVDEALKICRELGLGDLLDRMPAGLEQYVGETGWQLSHGERSRVFIARALLQRAPVVILDESFAALDPDTLEQSLACVKRRASSLVVVAHP